jgi:hypothetical protein
MYAEQGLNPSNHNEIIDQLIRAIQSECCMAYHGVIGVALVPDKSTAAAYIDKDHTHVKVHHYAEEWMTVVSRAYKEMSSAPSYMSPNAGERGWVAGSQPVSTAVHWSQNKLWRSNSIFNLWW